MSALSRSRTRTRKVQSKEPMSKSFFQDTSKPTFKIIEGKDQDPVFKPKYIEDPRITRLTSEDYKLFSNIDRKAEFMRYYETLSDTAKKSYENEESMNIDLIKNMETLPVEVLLTINDNLISFNARKHFLTLLTEKGLLGKYLTGLYDRDFYAPTGPKVLNDGIYEAVGGRRNRKRFTKYVRKRRGKKTRKYKNK